MPDAPLLSRLLAYVEERHPRFRRGIAEARDLDPERFARTAEAYLTWLVRGWGDDGLEQAVDAYVRFTSDVNLAQARYEAEGRYANRSFAEVYADHYSDRETMTQYLLGVYLTNFLWPHHFEIMRFFEDRFLATLPDDGTLIEIAPGHGGWGGRALALAPNWRLHGYDISPASLDVAGRIAAGAGVAERTSYTEADALTLTTPETPADAGICSFLVEHLEQPQRLFDVIAAQLDVGARAFVTAGLTAAQVDHIYEFRRESEVFALCEHAGLRVVESLSAAPSRTLPNAQFLPRSLAMGLPRRRTDIF